VENIENIENIEKNAVKKKKTVSDSFSSSGKRRVLAREIVVFAMVEQPSNKTNTTRDTRVNTTAQNVTKCDQS
jgi:hypothetical protein